jgi:hypothetical protein
LPFIIGGILFYQCFVTISTNNLLFSIGLIALLLIIGVILAVILTLPRSLTCFPHDARYFVQLVPNATIERVDPPMVCISQFDQVRKKIEGCAKNVCI